MGFAAVTADPQVFNPADDSGDHLHPNDAGYQTMADAIDLSTLLQAVLMAVTRRGEPLAQVVRGLWTTALWGAVG